MTSSRAAEQRLAATTYGDESAAVDVALLHGFTQSRASFAAVARGLIGRGVGRVESLDLPGHGESPLPEGEDGTAWAAEALASSVAPGVLVGYSMGARVCLRRTLDDPGGLSGLVLVGANPGLERPDEAAARRSADEALARRLETEPLEAFLDAWLSQPLFVHLDEEQAGRRARLVNRPERLAGALRALGVAAGPSMWGRLGELRRASMPVLLVAGARDEKFRAIGEEMADAIGPSAELALIDEAGHAAPFERPDAFVALLEGFVARTRR